MRPFLVAASLCLLAPSGTASETASDMEGGFGQTPKKEAFTQKQCLNVVNRVQKSGQYTEESIAPLCMEEMQESAGHCGFFAEALSLASSHPDFTGQAFCTDMDRAQFCSGILEKLLESTAVSDLAFGECERARPQKDIAYCRRIQQLLGVSVKQEDLDPMRTCYMMEAYTNTTGEKAKLEATEESPKMRIITGSNKELDSAGKGKGPKDPLRIISGSNKELDSAGEGKGPGHPPKESTVGKPGIVVQPAPLENFGNGNRPRTVVREPKPKGIITEPVPAGAAPAAAPVTAAPAAAVPILAEPVPAEQSILQKSRANVVMMADARGSAQPTLIAQPMMAEAVMQNGTLVMQGTPFGNVFVDQSRIEDILKHQAAATKQGAVTNMATAPKQATAQKQMTAPTQAIAPEQVSTKAKPGLLVVEPPRVVVAVLPAATQPAPASLPITPQPQAQTPASLPVAQVAVQPVKILQAMNPVPVVAPPQPVAQPAAQPVAQTVVAAAVVPQAAPQTSVQTPALTAPQPQGAVAQPVAQAVVAAPVQPTQVATPVVVARPAAPQAAPQPQAPAEQPVAQAVVAAPATPAHAAVQISVVAIPVQPTPVAAPATMAQPVVPPTAPQQLPKASAVQPVVQTVMAAPVQPTPVAAPLVVVHAAVPTTSPQPLPQAPAVQLVTQSAASSQVPPMPVAAPAVAARPAATKLATSPVPKAAAASVALSSNDKSMAGVATAQPQAKEPLAKASTPLRAVTKHPHSGLAQKQTKVDKKKEDKSEYAGFMSKFLA